MTKRRNKPKSIDTESIEGLEVLSTMMETEADELESGKKENPPASDMFVMSVGFQPPQPELRVSHAIRTFSQWIRMIIHEIKDS